MKIVNNSTVLVVFEKEKNVTLSIKQTIKADA